MWMLIFLQGLVIFCEMCSTFFLGFLLMILFAFVLLYRSKVCVNLKYVSTMTC